MRRLAACSALIFLLTGCGPEEEIYHDVIPGIACETPGAVGTTAYGVRMVCGTTDTDPVLQWRSK